jgi:hypothetical protein
LIDAELKRSNLAQTYVAPSDSAVASPFVTRTTDGMSTVQTASAATSLDVPLV